jgi:hypothetical protein
MSRIVRIARAWHAARADAGYTGFGLPESIGGRPGALIEEIIFPARAGESSDGPG